MLQVNAGLDQAEPGLLLLTETNAIVVHNHPAPVVQQPLLSYRPAGHLDRKTGAAEGRAPPQKTVPMDFIRSADALEGRRGGGEERKPRKQSKGDSGSKVPLSLEVPSLPSSTAAWAWSGEVLHLASLQSTLEGISRR